MGTRHIGTAPKYAPEDRIKIMRGLRLFHHTDWKSKKKIFTSSDVPVFTENIGIVKSKKKVYTSSDVLFSAESIGEEKKGLYCS